MQQAKVIPYTPYTPQSQQTEYDFTQENYDAHQVQRRIEDTDALIETGVGLAQGTILTGVQMVAVQSLYAMGTVGMFPVVVAGIPTAIAFGAALNTITIDEKLSISDLGKFGGGISRCLILISGSIKLHLDNNNSDNVAREGIATIKSQVDKYEGKTPEPSSDGSWAILLIIIGFIGAALWRLKINSTTNK
jgi:hypothetical protein